MPFHYFGKVNFVPYTKVTEFADYLKDGKLMASKCKKCGHIIEDVESDKDGNFPLKIDCINEECLAKRSCHKIIGCSIIIKDHMRALPKRGVSWAKDYMKKAKSPTGQSKRFY